MGAVDGDVEGEEVGGDEGLELGAVEGLVVGLVLGCVAYNTLFIISQYENQLERSLLRVFLNFK